MRHDAIVVGGAFAGLSAATYLARARRNVLVVDNGAPRNRFSAHSHGFFGHDGAEPRAMIETARAQVAAYPTAELRAGEVVDARATADGFEVAFAGGEILSAKKLVLAFGISDLPPEIPGLSERWGVSVLHCPYCHGFEFADQRLGVLFHDETSTHHAALIAEWGPTTLYLNGSEISAVDRDALARRGIAIEPRPILALSGEGAALSHVELEDGGRSWVDALYVRAGTRLNSPVAERLGCAIDDGPFGPVIRTDAQKETTVYGVFAAGDAARAPHSVAWAVADGVMAGLAAHRGLVFA